MMEWIEWLGLGLGGIIGLIMGLLGGGGSLIVPVLVYLLGKNITLATAYALFLIGLTAAFGVYTKWKRKEVDMKMAIVFAIPLVLGTVVARLLFIHILPDIWFSVGDLTISKRTGLLLLFALVLLLSFYSMVSRLGDKLRPNDELKSNHKVLYFVMVVILAFLIGSLSGLVGAGGGVLVMPVLVVLLGMEMKIAIGTSLAMSGAKSLMGFLADIYRIGDQLEWGFLISMAAVMIGGIYTGLYLGRHVPGDGLKKGFALLLFLMATFIIIREIFMGFSP